MNDYPTIPPPPKLPTGHVRLGATLPSAVVAAIISAAATWGVHHATAPAGDEVASLRRDVQTLTATVAGLAEGQRQLLDRINHDADASANARLIEALKQGRQP